MDSQGKRLLGFRASQNASAYKMKDPFIAISKGWYSLKDIHVPLAMESGSTPPLGNFPNNIVEYIWTHEGENDAENWYCLGRLESGAYFFLDAWCDYTGFDCKGGMKLYVSNSRPVLIQFAMSEQQYTLYLKETTYYKDIKGFKGFPDILVP